MLTGFTAQAAAFAPPEAEAVAQILAATIQRSMSFVAGALDKAIDAAGAGAGEVQEALDSFGAGPLIEGLKAQSAAVTDPADLAAIGTVLPLIKKIIRFIVDLFQLQPRFDLEKVLEFIDELATTAMDFSSPKGAEAMHRAEVRFLEAQFHLDRLGALKDAPVEVNGR